MPTTSNGHILPRADALAELDEITEQWGRGLLTNGEYKIAFGRIDACHSHDLRCANGDGRIAVLNIRGRLLCGVCAQILSEARA